MFLNLSGDCFARDGILRGETCEPTFDRQGAECCMGLLKHRLCLHGGRLWGKLLRRGVVFPSWRTICTFKFSHQRKVWLPCSQVNEMKTGWIFSSVKASYCLILSCKRSRRLIDQTRKCDMLRNWLWTLRDAVAECQPPPRMWLLKKIIKRKNKRFVYLASTPATFMSIEQFR